eukprot:8434181-Pyramimonas_sp.AAC.1
MFRKGSRESRSAAQSDQRGGSHPPGESSPASRGTPPHCCYVPPRGVQWTSVTVGREPVQPRYFVFYILPVYIFGHPLGLGLVTSD